MCDVALGMKFMCAVGGESGIEGVVSERVRE